MCQSEPAGFKAGSHVEGELSALALLHSLCHILLPLSLSPHTILSPLLSATLCLASKCVRACMHMCEFIYVTPIINFTGMKNNEIIIIILTWAHFDACVIIFVSYPGSHPAQLS